MHQRERNRIIKILYALSMLAVFCWCAEDLAAMEITNVRHWAAPDHTRVVFDLSAAPDYTFYVDDKLIILEFSHAAFHSSVPIVKKIDKPGVGRIDFVTIDQEKCKIEIQLSDHLTTEVFQLKKFMDKPDRVVVDVIVQMAETEDAAPEQGETQVEKKVIVIDPGHGGEDPGAIGKKGTYEKHVVLAISREIKKVIDKMPGYRAVLTRDSDYYVSFSKRLGIAKQNNASLFISVHADASRNRQAKCSSVYCLSTGAASNEAAKLLANNENLSDIIGGVPDGEGNNQSDEIILNMFQTNTINLSKTFAGGLIDQLGQVHCLKYPVFHEAPFRVLKLLDIPAVLLETAFLSHAQEERLLKTEKFRKKMAHSVALAVARYFSDASAVAAVKNTGSNKVSPRTIKTRKVSSADRPKKTVLYRVKKGEHLSSIARAHQTTVAVLVKLNRLNINDPLYVGQKLLLPDVSSKAADKKTLKNYIVKKGDTLYSLAKNSCTTVDELRRLNSMSDTDVLMCGRSIKLPHISPDDSR